MISLSEVSDTCFDNRPQKDPWHWLYQTVYFWVYMWCKWNTLAEHFKMRYSGTYYNIIFLLIKYGPENIIFSFIHIYIKRNWKPAVFCMHVPFADWLDAVDLFSGGIYYTCFSLQFKFSHQWRLLIQGTKALWSM